MALGMQFYGNIAKLTQQVHPLVVQMDDNQHLLVTPTEKKYSLTVGEALAVAQDLNSAKMFIFGC